MVAHRGRRVREGVNTLADFVKWIHERPRGLVLMKSWRIASPGSWEGLQKQEPAVRRTGRRSRRVRLKEAGKREVLAEEGQRRKASNGGAVQGRVVGTTRRPGSWRQGARTRCWRSSCARARARYTRPHARTRTHARTDTHTHRHSGRTHTLARVRAHTRTGGCLPRPRLFGQIARLAPTAGLACKRVHSARSGGVFVRPRACWLPPSPGLGVSLVCILGDPARSRARSVLVGIVWCLHSSR